MSVCVASAFVSHKVGGTTPPTVDQVAWTYTTAYDTIQAGENDYFTVKAARPLSNGQTVALLFRGETESTPAGMAALALLNADGSVAWGPTDFGAQHGEGTDIVVAADGSGFVISGHAAHGGGVSGKLTKVSLTGEFEWTKNFQSVDQVVYAEDIH